MKNILLIILFTTTSFGQVTEEWVAIYSSPINFTDLPKGIVVNSQGDVFIACSLYASAQAPKGVIIKYNSSGQEEWVIPFGGEEVAFISDIEIDASGNIYVTGGTGPNLNNVQLTTIKYNSSGTSLWVNKYNRVAEGEDVGLAITLDQTGNVYVTGYGLTAATGSNYITIKYNVSGVREWVKIFDDGARAIDICVDFSNNVYITGFSHGLSSSNNNYITVKYNQTGLLQWAKSYDGPGSSEDTPAGIVVDLSGNVIVTGYSSSDYATIKYNPSGDTLWVNRYHGGYGSDRAWGIVVDDERSVYVTGLSQMASNSVTVTIKYDSLGNQQWLRSDNGGANAMAIDSDRNIYIVGSINTDYRTLKYNSNGDQIWVKTYSRPGISNDSVFEIVLDLNHNVYVAGYSWLQGSNNFDAITLKYSQGLNIISPQAGEKWIAGETDTIKWTGGQAGKFLIIEYSSDDGATYIQIDAGAPADSNYYVWKIPKGILTTKAKIKLTDVIYFEDSTVSDAFKIKGYILTRMNSSGNYDPYTKFRDPYSFGNDSASVWPIEFWQNFDYTGTDPFTGYNYLLGVPALLLLQTSSSDHSDWVSWVRTFGVPACYYNTSFPPVYSRTALTRWIDISDEWGGSCFGMSTSNILLFNNKTEFLNQYPSFPDTNALLILPNDSVRTVINELYTHQFGLEHRIYRATTGLLKTPNQTLGEIKAMLLDDDPLVRTLSIVSNDPTDPGGHSIMAYKVEQDTIMPNLYYVFTYDNSYPGNLDSAIIVIDTAANNNNGTWTPMYAWTNWGGTKWFYLRDPAITYFVNPSMPKKQQTDSPFILGENELQILNSRKASIRITDQQGNSSGYVSGILLNNIPGSIPNIIENGSSGPPIGYDLPTTDYSVQLREYQDQDASISFYTSNKVFSVQRNSVQISDNDHYYFDGGVSLINPDQSTKNFNLINIINESALEKAFFISELDLSQNDSLKIVNPDENTLDLISYGSAKNYKIELNHASPLGLGRFENDNISIGQNTTHKLTPDWSNINELQLIIYVDHGNDGTIDDTLEIENQVTGIGDDEGSLLTPNNYNLAQNFPNPFNPTTMIQYSIPQRGNVTLKVYDVLGNEIATLVNEEKDGGVYSVNFDASQLASGLYLYKLQAGSFVETKKMILLR